MSQNLDKNTSNEAKRRIMQYANDCMHEALANNDIIVVAKHNRLDPRKFEIIADSEYDKALEGVQLIFENPDDFARVFPDFVRPPPVVLAPNMEMDQKRGIAVPIHEDPYVIRNVYSFPQPANPDINSPENILTGDKVMVWAVDKNPATLLLDLGQDSELGSIWIWWTSGNKKQYNFTVAVATEEQFTKQNKTFAVIDHLSEVWSSGTEDFIEPYKLVTDPEMLTKARYVMVKVYGNTEDNWASITQLQVTKAVSIKSCEQINKTIT